MRIVFIVEDTGVDTFFVRNFIYFLLVNLLVVPGGAEAQLVLPYVQKVLLPTRSSEKMNPAVWSYVVVDTKQRGESCLITTYYVVIMVWWILRRYCALFSSSSFSLFFFSTGDILFDFI